MRRRTKIVLAITFMVAALVTSTSYIFISQMLRQRVATAHDTAMYLTSQLAYLSSNAAPDLTSTRVDTNNPEAVRRGVAYYLGTDRDLNTMLDSVVGSWPTIYDATILDLDGKAILHTDPNLVGKSLINPKIIGVTSELATLVRTENIDRLVVAISDRRGQFPTQELLKLSLSGDVTIEESASFYERLTGRVLLDLIRPSWLIFSTRGRHARINQITRSAMHRAIALVGAMLSVPIAILTAILIKLDSPGPVLYKQDRVGKNGRPFKLMKFRSMRTDAEKDGPVWAKTDDDRTTRVGRIIRKIRVDEIPQFWNILRGDMNFVGPRPERPHFVAQLAQEIRYYDQRHLIAPGLTGWAQINYPYGASIDDAKQKLQYDLYYMKNQCLALDATIMFETIKTVLFGRGT